MSKKKQVQCIETGVTFDSVSRLSIAIKVYESFILDHLAGKKDTLLGKKYKYV